MSTATTLTKKEMDTLNIDNLDENRKSQIMSIKNSIGFSYEDTLNFASDASKNLTEFSSDLLKTMKLKDTPEVEELINELMSGLDKIDTSNLTEKKPSLFSKIFRVNSIKNFINRYEDIEDIINTVKSKLESVSFQLKKDIEVCNRYSEQNLNYINELDNYIMAGRLKLKEEQELLDKERENIDEEDILTVHNLNSRQNELDRFDRKLHNLLLMRTVAIQNIPQIMLIKNGDSVLIERIQTSVDTAIPLWESQMVITIELMRQKGALAIQKSVTNTTNSLIEKNSELLKTSSIEIAKELETGIVDIEVLKKNSTNLIDTLNSIKMIRDDGRKNRLKATEELAALQVKLNEQLLLKANNT